jgi:hypothetical protein
MEQDKKKLSPAPVAATTPAPAAEPVPTASIPRPRFKLISRETKIGAVVGASFLAVAGGIMGVKSLWKETALPPETPLATQPPVGLEAPPAPSTTRFAPVEAPPPAPMPVLVPEVRIESAIQPARADLVIPEPKLEAPVIAPPPPSDIPVFKEPAVVAPPPPALEIPAFKEPAVVAPPPAGDPFKANAPRIEAPKIEAPAMMAADPLKPEAKNPVIRISASEPKKDGPPAIEAPPLIDLAPPPEPKKIETPRIETPSLEPITPPVKIEAPMREPIPPLKIDAPTRIDLAPRKDNPPTAEPERKDGEYDEDLHSLRQNESYRSLSKQYYNSEAYAIALQRYNRDHPGQADYARIPPIWVLEKKYADDISGAQARAVNYQQPAVVDAAPRNDPVYTVSDNGEMLAEIARRQLGSEDAWKSIWDLNPGINPAKSIPGGTRLKMPR